MCHSLSLAHSQATDRPLLTTNSYNHDTHNQYNRKRQHNNKYRPKPTPMNSLKTRYEIILKIIDIGIVLPEKPNIAKLYLPPMGRKKK